MSSVVDKNRNLGTKVYNFSNEPVNLVSGIDFGRAEAVGYSDDVIRTRSQMTSTVNAAVAVTQQERLDFLEANLRLEGTDLNSEQRSELKDLIFEYADIFAVGDHDLGMTNLVEHHVDTADAKPIYQRPYRAEFQKRAVIEREVNKMLEMDVIEKNNSAWSSPVVLVTKKDGSVRFCINYIKLNDVTVRDSYCLPRIEDILENLRNCSYFTSLDLFSGYWQIPMAEDSKDKTTFTCFLGTFNFKRMPFGLKNAPSTFQRLLERILCGILYDDVFVYIDDILVAGKTWAIHLAKIHGIMQNLFIPTVIKLELCIG